MADQADPAQEEGVEDPQSSGFRTLAKAFDLVLSDDTTPNEECDRVTIYMFANGDVSYRVYPVGSDDPEAGFIPGE